MKIIGCDFHSRQQTLAILDTATGEVERTTLRHEGDNVREFYSNLPGPVRVGIEATGSMQWFVNLTEELGIECLVGHPAEIRAAEPRKQKHDRRDADLLLSLLVEERFPSIWLPTKELLDIRACCGIDISGWDCGSRYKCAAGNCFSEWPSTRFLLVDASRTKGDRIFAVVTPCGSSAE
jgi:Transposase